MQGKAIPRQNITTLQTLGIPVDKYFCVLTKMRIFVVYNSLACIKELMQACSNIQIVPLNRR